MFGVIVNPVSGGREAAGLAVQITERIAALGEESRWLLYTSDAADD